MEQSEAGHSHEGHSHAEEPGGGVSHGGHSHAGHSHSGHSHGGHSHGGHSHAGHHHHAPPDGNNAAFAIGAGLNAAFVVAEMAFGLTANSVALVADALHNLGDVLSLLLAWGAAWLSRRPPTRRRTYGWGRSSILAALINAVVLLIGVGAIGVEGVTRLLNPQPVVEATVIWVALAGVAVNGVSALLFMRDRKSDLNIRAQFLHLAGDALVSIGVVVAAVVIQFTGLLWIDPLASLAIAAVILAGTWNILRESVDLSLDAVPEQIPHADVEAWLARLPGVAEVHDLHIWGLSTTETALTAHLVCEDGRGTSLHDVVGELRRRFGIGHATLQVESASDADLCRLRPENVV